MDLAELRKTIAAGESETVEFKKSTGQLTRAGETLCAFLNGQGGQVLIGVTPEGKAVGQQIADSTLREVAAMLARFEPPAPISQERIRLPKGPEVLVLAAPTLAGDGPFTFEGRAYQRIGSTTLARASCRITPSAISAWPGSKALTKPRFSTTGRYMATPLICSTKP